MSVDMNMREIAKVGAMYFLFGALMMAGIKFANIMWPMEFEVHNKICIVSDFAETKCEDVGE